MTHCLNRGILPHYKWIVCSGRSRSYTSAVIFDSLSELSEKKPTSLHSWIPRGAAVTTTFWLKKYRTGWCRLISWIRLNAGSEVMARSLLINGLFRGGFPWFYDCMVTLRELSGIKLQQALVSRDTREHNKHAFQMRQKHDRKKRKKKKKAFTTAWITDFLENVGEALLAPRLQSDDCPSLRVQTWMWLT